MNEASLYQFRIDKQEKAEVFAILNEIGIKPAQAMRLFFQKIREARAMPFPVEHIPNEKTAKILMSNDYIGSFETVEELFDDLNK